MKIIERLVLEPRRSLHLVEVDGEILLVGTSEHSVQLLERRPSPPPSTIPDEEENAGKEGIVTTESGLQYQIITEGKGEKPKETDRVSVNYTGTLIDGTEFDSSFKRGKPATFSVNRVVKGWTEALQLMPVGSKWQVFIPPELGYGERGAGAKIGPNSVLIFEMELLKIVSEDDKPKPDLKAPGKLPRPAKK